jgi:hypothetical protein
MNTSIREIINDWTARLTSDSSLAIAIDATYGLVIQGQEGGAWTLDCKTPASVHEGLRAFDCKVTMSAEDLKAISERRLNPQKAYQEGRIKLEGNIIQALKLNRLFFDE